MNKSTANYEVACRCGAVCSGQRQRRHQEIRCAVCRRLVFVLPHSPLGGGVAESPGRDWPIWLLPASAAGVTLLACVGLYFLVLNLLVPAAPAGPEPRLAIEERIQAGQQALEREDYARARKEWTAARALAEQHPQVMTAAARNQLEQGWREAGILAAWSAEPLDLIAQRGMNLREDEWQAVTKGYLGRGMVFDLVVRRDAGGTYFVTFNKEAANRQLRLEMQNQAMLKYLPLNEPRRLLLGGRLGDLRRDDQGLVHVRLEPDSTVLLTDPVVLKTCALVIDRAGVAELAAEQRKWALDLPRDPP